jgi:hypothetical protein
MGRPDHPPVIVGWRLLAVAAREGQFAPHRREGPRIQVDSRPVSLLADAHAVQRDRLPQRAQETRFAPSRKAGHLGQGRVLLVYLIGARRAAARQAEGEARGETVGNEGTAVRRLSTASCCGQRRCPRAGAG